MEDLGWDLANLAPAPCAGRGRDLIPREWHIPEAARAQGTLGQHSQGSQGGTVGVSAQVGSMIP